MKRVVLAATFVLAFSAAGMSQESYKNGSGTSRGTGEGTSSPYGRNAPPPRSGGFSASHIQATREFFILAGLNTIYDTAIEVELQKQIAQNPQLKPFAETMRQFFRKYASWAAIESDVATIYMSNFTEPEIRQMNAFAQTSAGKKLFRNLDRFTQGGGLPSESELQRIFTPVEQKQLLTFTRTAVYQKLIERTPVMAEQGAAIGKRKVEQHQSELEEMIRRRAQQLQQQNGN
jgi:hypothetical protein